MRRNQRDANHVVTCTAFAAFPDRRNKMTVVQPILGIATIVALAIAMVFITRRTAAAPHMSVLASSLCVAFFHTARVFWPTGTILAGAALILSVVVLARQHRKTDSTLSFKVRRIRPAEMVAAKGGAWQLRRPVEELSQSGVWRIRYTEDLSETGSWRLSHN